MFRFLQFDRDELDALKEARILEEEKAQFSVRDHFNYIRF